MSTTTIRPRRGTPFEQIAKTRPRPRPVPPRAADSGARRPHRTPQPRPDAPPRSHQQRIEALQLANDVRSRRANLKRDLKARRTGIIPLLLDPPGYIGTMKVFDLMLAVPTYGRVKVTKILTVCRISPSKTIGGLSERQRGELANTIIRRG